MKQLPNISDAEIDRLLAGHATEDSSLRGVSQFLQDVDSAFAEEPTDALEATHIAAMVEVAKSVEPAEPEARRAPMFAFKAIAAHKWVSAAVLSAMTLLAFGGAAYAGVLPDSVQDATSTVVQRVGIRIPKARRLRQAKFNNGVRDHGAGIGNGKGQGGVRRDLGNVGKAGVIATGTTAADGAKTTTGTATVGATKASSTSSPTPKAAARALAKRRLAQANRTAAKKARAKVRKRAQDKKRVKRRAKRHEREGESRHPSVVQLGLQGARESKVLERPSAGLIRPMIAERRRRAGPTTNGE